MTSYCTEHDKNTIKAIKKSMQDENVLVDLSDFFKLLGDSTRMKIICVLFLGDICVGGIAESLDMSQSAISHQLRILKSHRIVKSKKKGKQVFYSLDDDHIKMIYELGLEHILERR